MKKKKVWRYWCDHCGKGGCSASGMKIHEQHCTLNPSRICRMCQIAGLSQQGSDYLVANYDKGDLEALRSAANGCPACMLSALRIWKKRVGIPKYGEHSEEVWDNWDFKKECSSFWAEVNADKDTSPY